MRIFPRVLDSKVFFEKEEKEEERKQKENLILSFGIKLAPTYIHTDIEKLLLVKYQRSISIFDLYKCQENER